jgi:hypothetical protein
MEQEQRSGFWSSLPGLLTGSAALITAVTGGYLAYDRSPAGPGSASAHPAEVGAEAKPLAVSQPQSPAPATPAAAAESALIAPSAAEMPATVVDSGGTASPPADARPSFDCGRAATVVETMLCSNAGLADRDQRMAAQYRALRGTLPPDVRSQLLQSQRLFLRQRSDCRSSQCLADLYDVRLRQLAEFASN